MVDAASVDGELAPRAGHGDPHVSERGGFESARCDLQARRALGVPDEAIGGAQGRAVEGARDGDAQRPVSRAPGILDRREQPRRLDPQHGTTAGIHLHSASRVCGGFVRVLRIYAQRTHRTAALEGGAGRGEVGDLAESNAHAGA